jgi:hypothetical protein
MRMMQHRQIPHIALGVHKASIAVAIAEDAATPTSYGNIANDPVGDSQADDAPGVAWRLCCREPAGRPWPAS